MALTAAERITRAKIKLYEDEPFLSYIVNHLKTIEDNNLKHKTMAVDAKGNCYYDKKFVENLDNKVLTAVLAHEALHCAFEHLSRHNKRQPDVWNIATDMLINNFLQKRKYQLPDKCIMPYRDEYEFQNLGKKVVIKDIDKKIAESIYNELMQIVPKSKMKEFVAEGEGFDEHRLSKGQQKGAGKGTGQDIDWKKVLAEANTHAKQRGKGSSDLDRIVDAALNEKINWKRLLSRYMTNDIASNYSYARPSKRSWGAGAYLPYLSKESMNVTIAIDTSGSIQQKELSEFMGQVYSIVRSFHNIKLTLLFHDDEITSEKTYNNMNLRDILKVKPKGGGGTSHQPIMDYTKKNNVNVLVCFTDGYSDINYCNNKFKKSIFVLTTDSCEEPKYGRSVYFERGD